VRASIGAALQEAALDAILTGREHLLLQATLQGIPKATRKKRAQELLERVGLTEAADRRVGGYSGGMKRRLDLALALVHSPRILFLDEPTTGLDLQSRTALWSEVARLAHDEGMTVFLTTQYLEEADALADRVGIIDHGKIVARTRRESQGRDRQPDRGGASRRPRRGRCHCRGVDPLRLADPRWRGSLTVQLPAGRHNSRSSFAYSTRPAFTLRRCTSTSRHSMTCSSPRLDASSKALRKAKTRRRSAEPPARGRRRRGG